MFACKTKRARIIKKGCKIRSEFHRCQCLGIVAVCGGGGIAFDGVNESILVNRKFHQPV